MNVMQVGNDDFAKVVDNKNRKKIKIKMWCKILSFMKVNLRELKLLLNSVTNKGLCLAVALLCFLCSGGVLDEVLVGSCWLYLGLAVDGLFCCC